MRDWFEAFSETKFGLNQHQQPGKEIQLIENYQ
jgi:hypothetical protein